MAHTPGPWQALGKHIAATKQYAPGHPYLIAEMLKHRSGMSDRVPFGMDGAGDQEANARLIAAAPDMLEALRHCVSDDGALCWRNHAFAKKRLTHINEIVRAVLAKAEG